MLQINYNNKLFYVLLGFTIILYIIYIRILVVRAPRDLNLFNPSLNWQLLFIICCGIIISSFIFIKMIRLILNKQSNPMLKIVQDLFLKLSNMVDKALNETYSFVADKLSNNYEVVSNFAQQFYKLFGKRNEAILIFISFSCRFPVVSFFLFDIFYFFRLNYFYNVLILLLIPLIINTMIYILRDFADNYEDILSYLNVTDVPNSDQLIYTLSTGNEDVDLNYQLEELERCSKIKGYLQVYDFALSYYTPRVTLILHLLYLIGWLYILFFNILHLS